MTMRTIKLNNGTVLNVSDCGAADGILWIRLTEPISITKAALTFSDSANTSVIHHEYGDNDKVDFVGYTELVSLQKQSEGTLIAMKKGM